LPFTARIERAPFHRARSASKKGTWPLPPHPSEAARCASTEDHQAPSPSLRSRFPTSLGGSLVDPRLRASNEHLPHRNRSLQACSFSLHGRVACLVSYCARPTRGVRDRALREHRRSSAPSPPMRGHPRIPCRFKSPRIDRASPPSSEPLNFPQLSSAFSPSQHRHSGCSSMWPMGERIADEKGGEYRPTQYSETL